MYQQLVKKPSGNERPGYRGEAAAASAAASSSGMQGRSVGSDPQGRGDGPATGDRGVYASRDPSGQYNIPAQEKAREILEREIGLGDKMNIPNFLPGGKLVRTFLNKKKVREPNFFDKMQRDLTRELGPEEEEETGGDGGNNPFILPQYMMPTPSITDQEQEPEEQLTELQRMLRDRGDVARRFAADGGIMDADVVGGEFDFESARQMYGLGKLVKKATRAVKKVASSPIGKAAIAYTLTGGLGNLASGQRFFSNFMSPTAFLGNTGSIFSREGLRNIAFGKPGFYKSLSSAPGKGVFTKGTAGILGSGGNFSALKGITAASILPLLGIGTGDESEEEAQAILDNTGIDINKLRNDETYRDSVIARRFKAEGGPAEGKEPVAKKVMPLLDMDGMEKDYRETGGFVPIGRMEKADDVPARLSKNEFVFTADAVRNAGDGDIDKGAEVMYNMMKHLEDGGDVSEESQGLEGARNMFQTSQRLEEVL